MDTERDHALAEIAAAQHGVFDRRLLRELGFTKHHQALRLAQLRWIEEFDGVFRMAGAPRTPRAALLAGVLTGSGITAASHRSAAGIWETAGGRDSHPEILCTRYRRAKHAGLIVHESKALTEQDITVVDAIPVTTIERTLVDIGAVCSEATVERALESALRRELTTIRALEGTVARLGKQGRNGVGRLRKILDERTPDRRLTESDMELRLLQILRANGLPEPVPQYEVWLEGRFIARVDLAYVEWRIALDYESYTWHVGNKPLVANSRRRNALITADWMPIAVTWPDLQSGGSRVCGEIRRLMRRAA